MIIIKLCVIAVAGVLVLNVIKSNNPSHKLTLQLLLVVGLIIYVMPQIKELLTVTESFSVTNGLSSDSIKLMLKIFVVLTSGSFCADICRDNGESAVANALEVASRIVAVTCALPIFTAVISIAQAFMQG